MSPTAGARTGPVVEVGRFAGRDIIVQYGLEATPASFQARIRRLLRFYLGSDEAPVPFGGRDREVQELNCWLYDTDVGNLLITAPAGRGKTALLVRWIHQLDPAWPVAFIPISIRFGTNREAVFYQALAARLAEILGKKLPAGSLDSAAFYKDQVVEYLDAIELTATRCLVVIDGLDEATGWRVDSSVLPLNSSAKLKPGFPG